MLTPNRVRYFFNKTVKPGTVAISTKRFEMNAMYAGLRHLPATDFARRELPVDLYGYASFDIEATSAVLEEFEDLHQGRIHAKTALALTKTKDGEEKWEPTTVTLLTTL